MTDELRVRWTAAEPVPTFTRTVERWTDDAAETGAP